MISILTLASYLHMQLLDTAKYHDPAYDSACKSEFGMTVAEFCEFVKANRDIPAYVDRPRYLHGVRLPSHVISAFGITFPARAIGNSAALMSDGSIYITYRDNMDNKRLHNVKYLPSGADKLPRGQICNFLTQKIVNSDTEVAIRIIRRAMEICHLRNQPCLS